MNMRPVLARAVPTSSSFSKGKGPTDLPILPSPPSFLYCLRRVLMVGTGCVRARRREPRKRAYSQGICFFIALQNAPVVCSARSSRQVSDCLAISPEMAVGVDLSGGVFGVGYTPGKILWLEAVRSISLLSFVILQVSYTLRSLLTSPNVHFFLVIQAMSISNTRSLISFPSIWGRL